MDTTASLASIAEISRRYGSDPAYVFLGGGNTSYKDDTDLYIKPSGVALATIQPEQFLRMDRQALRKVFELDENLPAVLREELVKNYQLAAVRPLGAGRPSVEAPVHELLPFRFVVHTHPALVNAMTCAVDGAAVAAKLFPQALWLDYCDPGSTLARVVIDGMEKYRAANDGKNPQVLFLQKHGVFVAADSCEEIHDLYQNIFKVLGEACVAAGVALEESAVTEEMPEAVLEVAPKLRALLAVDGRPAVVHYAGSGSVFDGPLTPDHIVYAKSFAYKGEADAAAIQAFKAQRGYLPKVLEIPGCGCFTAGATLDEALSAKQALENARQVQRLTAAFGGAFYMTEREYSFIENWEVESYRRSVNGGGAPSRLAGKVCVVTGGAQGFGLGIAEYLASQGGIMVLADMNAQGAADAAADLCKRFGRNRAFAVGVNVADEESVAAMVKEVVRMVGGIDLFVANAGVVRSGSVTELSLKDFKFVTDINYIGYFLCVKYAAQVMGRQMLDGTSPWTDIVQVNSKSGLEGSNRNGAYAGSKFGGIGLTQSFAKELVTSHIKVNSVCPGNYLDGPLWSDPVRGLFVQYLNSGKVPGATTVEEVREFYMSKVPMHRGCLPADVAKAIIYCVEQDYETGQAIPVTGGQNMLHA